MLRVSHKFGRLEALGVVGAAGRFNDAADPISLTMVVTLRDDITRVVETQSINALSHGTPKPFKLATGLWACDLNERLYTSDIAYVVNWRYSMTPGNDKVDRDTFLYGGPARPARDAGNCNIYGTVTDMIGLPLSNVDVTAEMYNDIITMTKRTGQRTIRTDPFGNWSVELPRKSLVRFVLGDASKIIMVPDQNYSSLSSIEAFQPADAQKDRFGYAYP